MQEKIGRRTLLAGVLGLGFGASAASRAWAAAPPWVPARPVEIIVGVSPGGSMDRTARSLALELSERQLLPQSSIVLNKPGAGHAIALGYTAKHRGDGELIQLINSPLLTNKLLGSSQLNQNDVTPLANMFFEQMVFAVGRNSTIKDGRDLIARLKADAGAFSFSVSSGHGTVNELAVLLLAAEIGADPRNVRTISFMSASQGTTSVIGGHVDVLITTPFSIVPFIDSGELRPIAVASGKRLDRKLANVPTWRELGADVVTPGMRVVIAPPDIGPEQVAFWGGALQAVARSPSWNKTIASDYCVPDFIGPDRVKAYLARENERVEKIYRAVGVIG